MHHCFRLRPPLYAPPPPQSSRGNVKKCVDERSAPPPAYPGTSQAPQPIQLLCTSFNHCGWSNNAAMFRKHFWLKVYSSGASLTHDGNGMFEVRRSRQNARVARAGCLRVATYRPTSCACVLPKSLLVVSRLPALPRPFAD